jgi:hypothetical protein
MTGRQESVRDEARLSRIKEVSSAEATRNDGGIKELRDQVGGTPGVGNQERETWFTRGGEENEVGDGRHQYSHCET